MSSKVDDFNDFSSDGEDNQLLIQSKKAVDFKLAAEQDIENDEQESAEIVESRLSDSKTSSIKGELKDVEDNEEDDQDSKGEVGIPEEELTEEQKRKSLKKKMAKFDTLKAQRKLRHKTGVVYLSAIPPYMKPAKMRQILSRFGEMDRLFLKRESDKKYKSRIKGGGNKKTMYEEGWAEFVRKRDAKLCAITLNGNTIGGSKGSFYHDDILNVKYLPGFKWADLTEQIARENDIRQSKLDLEISQANKMNAEFIRNVEKSKMLENIKKASKRKNIDVIEDREQGDNGRFKQHRVATKRADAPEAIKSKEANMDQIINNLL